MNIRVRYGVYVRHIYRSTLQQINTTDSKFVHNKNTSRSMEIVPP